MLQDHPAAVSQLFPTADVHLHNVALTSLNLLKKHPMASAVASISLLSVETSVLPQHSQQLAVLSQLSKLSAFTTAGAPISAFTMLPKTL